MRTKTPSLLIPLLTCSAAWAGQPATLIRFQNGTNQITVAPGTAVPVSVYATGLPALNTPIPWTTPPGTGQMHPYAGFLSAVFDMQATGGAWSNLIIPTGMGFQIPPFGNAGTPAGTNVTGIAIGVGFNPPVTLQEFLLWRGTVTVGAEMVKMSTALQPLPWMPPQVGFEGALNWGGGSYASNFFNTLNGSAVITVPTPGAFAPLALALAWPGRRRPSDGPGSNSAASRQSSPSPTPTPPATATGS